METVSGWIETSLIANCFVRLSCLAYSSILKTEATCSSETSIGFQQTTWRYIPEGRTLLKLSI
jgi:hypothetical protein